MPRHNFSPKVKRQARERSGGRCEAEGVVYGLDPGQRCNAPLAGKRVEIDHYPIPATDEGSDTLENAVTCCTDCHGFKTRKLDDFLARGWEISGYAIHKDGEHGLVTTGGFVGWFTTAQNNASEAERLLAEARAALTRIAAIKYPTADTHYALKATIDYARDQARASIGGGNG